LNGKKKISPLPPDYAMKGNVLNCLGAGMNMYLKKPVHMDPAVGVLQQNGYAPDSIRKN
jgi:hypothetical protein